MPRLEHVAPVAAGEFHGWRPWILAALDLVFPPLCPVCDSILGAGRRDPICGGCWEGFDRITPPWCRCCGAPLTTEGLCGPCRIQRPSFAYARAAVFYGDLVREAIHAFKFGGRRALATPLGDLIAGISFAALPGAAPDGLLPVPLHPSRARERGYDQALLLARSLGRAWGVPVVAGALVRTVPTQPQTDLDAPARRRNVRDAFAVRRPELIADRHVALVDDVLTTGATTGECARSLYRAGAATVGVLTVARAL